MICWKPYYPQIKRQHLILFFYKGLVILIALPSAPFKESIECSQSEYHVFVNISLLGC